ncbi:hypothetical protein LFL96_29715 [Paraburkholderia sp. D15]|uniref:hypothetical protein n=1 Tax=Paraburkholderia sp. D15 TaxID=2880218 RepID=UPI0024786577|nr:hypothetical protein [Paraburkholderia sp. D15]WGS52376.1 hypothetical protein LFL96_29715 [Paraburkholderia sp. D15]
MLLKCVAGVLGGFGLAIAASALLARLSPGGLTAASKFHVVMWLVPPLWIAVVSAAFLFRGAARAFVWLAVANAAAFALVLVCQRWPV